MAVPAAICVSNNGVTMCSLDEIQLKKLNDWLIEIEPDIVAVQKQAGMDRDKPYYGAAGGGLTYEFTPHGLGTTFIVREFHTKKTIDLTDYDEW